MKRARVNARREQAFTLVELLIAVAVVAVLLTLAAPSFRDFILMQRLKGVHAQLVTDLQYARSEAVSSGAVVNVRVETLVGTQLSCYIIFHHYSRNYLLSGASGACNCRAAPGSRCPNTTDYRELRTVQLPLGNGIKFKARQTTRQVAFDPQTGGMMLRANELFDGTGIPFGVDVEIDTARSLAAIVGLSGQPRICKPTGSAMPEIPC
jgi:prepilin-type N-terminal cleavage/methylation domain-containing protein